ncbi:AAA family ATPase [Legionella londiniensis]|uniref:AAA family ATPase n=1 Tax=Legionella londiniensis TaxID=45068 RepID=UPI00399CFF3F
MNSGLNQFKAEQNNASEAIYKPASWITKIAFINHLIKGNNNVLLAVLGEQGGGKTTFAHLLKANIDEQIKTYFVAASPLFDHAFFLSQLGLILNHQGDHSIRGYIEQSQNAKTHTLIIIDDAHYLSEEFIQDLIHALQEQGTSCYFHVCLISNYSILRTLNKAGKDLNQDMIHSIELGSLSESEAKDYIRYRLLSRLGFLTDERLKQFYELTDGNIVGINTQLDSFFGNSSLVQKVHKKSNKTGMRFTLVAAAVFVALGIAFIVEPHRQITQPDRTQTKETVAVVTPLPQQPATIQQAKVETAPLLNSYIPGYQINAERQDLVHVSLNQKTSLMDLDEIENEVEVDESLVLLDKVIVIPKNIKKESNEPQKLSEKKHNHPSVSKANGKAQKPVTRQTNRLTKDMAKRGKYTIQLLASHNTHSLEHFAQMNHIKEKSKIRRTQKQGIDWYVLTLGEYDKRDTAKLAASRLPLKLAQLNPWVRPIAELRDIG